MAKNEYVNYTLDRLQAKEQELRKELRQLRFDKTLAKLDNTAKLKIAKKELARVLTHITEVTQRGEQSERA